MNIYVGSLSYEVTAEDLKGAFEAYGSVKSANVIMDKFSGHSKGFGFVEMDSDEEAKRAIEGLNGQNLKGRTIVVNEARPKTEGGGGGGGNRRPGGGGNRRPGGGGGFGGGGGKPRRDRNDRGGDRW